MARLISICALLALMCVAACAASIPTFPQSFTVQELDTMAIYQGDYTVSGSQLCCAFNSDSCKVQTQTQAGNNFVDAVNQRTRFDVFGSDQSIVTVYSANKQYLVQNNTCQYYCPLQDDEWVPFGVDANATLVGTKVVDGIECNDYQWKTTILGIVVMEITDFYADMSQANPVPVAQLNQLTPFGQAIGTESSSWEQFMPGVPPASLWTDIQGLDNCPQYNQCNDNSQMMNNFLRQKLFKTWAYYRSQKNAEKSRRV